MLSNDCKNKKKGKQTDVFALVFNVTAWVKRFFFLFIIICSRRDVAEYNVLCMNVSGRRFNIMYVLIVFSELLLFIQLQGGLITIYNSTLYNSTQQGFNILATSIIIKKMNAFKEKNTNKLSLNINFIFA